MYSKTIQYSIILTIEFKIEIIFLSQCEKLSLSMLYIKFVLKSQC